MLGALINWCNLIGILLASFVVLSLNWLGWKLKLLRKRFEEIISSSRLRCLIRIGRGRFWSILGTFLHHEFYCFVLEINWFPKIRTNKSPTSYPQYTLWSLTCSFDKSFSICMRCPDDKLICENMIKNIIRNILCKYIVHGSIFAEHTVISNS